MKKIISCYIPNIVNNPYAINVRRILKDNNIETYSIKEVFSHPKLFFKCKVFNFNWYENITSKKEYYTKTLLIAALRFFNKKIIYTVHNKQPHDANYHLLSKNIMQKMVKNADMIIGLCPETEEVIKEISPQKLTNLRIVKHPNYIKNYDGIECNNYRAKFDFSEDEMVFLFLGFIAPYKNLELLIDIFKNNNQKGLKLLIAGSTLNDSYKNSLIDRIGNSNNITCDFRYIPDSEIPAFYQCANIVVMPYHKTSSLNSGAVFLSFSLGRTVICPDIGTMKALEDHSFVYQYEYKEESEHEQRLQDAIMKAFNDFCKDPEIINNKGCQAYDYVKKRHSDELIGMEYRQLYDDLINVK